MDPIPRPLLDGLTASTSRDVEAWWAAFHDDARAEVISLWDGRRDGCFFGIDADDPSGPVPAVIGGRFVPHDDAWGLAEWGPGYFEHMLDHPEQFPVWEPTSRTFHIGCTAHPEARACLASGLIPADFRCPFHAVGCPMSRLLATAPGRSLRLVPTPTGRLLVGTPAEVGTIA